MRLEIEGVCPDVDASLLSLVAHSCERAEGLTGRYQAFVMFVTDARIREINREMRGKDAATDVLSFPSCTYPHGTARQSEERLRRELDPDTGCAHLGDIVISLERARAQADEYGHSVAREIGYLLAHGLFHIMGYDHMTDLDKRAMRAKEEEALTMAGIMREVDKALLEAARAMTERSYAPYSKYAVGAALRAQDGRIYTGCNVECASYGMTVCAERTALCKAVSDGVRSFEAIAIASSGSAPYPCGACRQMLYEFAPGLRVLVTWDGEVRDTTLRALLPEGFGPGSLPEQGREADA